MGSKVAQQRQREEQALRDDPTEGLRRRLRAALDDEDYAAAARARDALRDAELHRAAERMHRDLRRLVSLRRTEAERLGREDPLRALEARLAALVDAEDYEAAAAARDALRRARFDRLMEGLAHEVGARAAAGALPSPPAVSDPAGDPAVAGAGPERLEEELDAAVRAEDYGRAARLRDALLRGDAARRLERALARAVRRQRFAAAARIKAALLDVYRAALSPPVLRALGVAPAPPSAADPAGGGGAPAADAPAFRVGDVVVHRELGYRGVVVAWDDACRASPAWLAAAASGQAAGGEAGAAAVPRGRFYHVLPDTRDVSPLPGPAAAAAAAGGGGGVRLGLADCRPAFVCGLDPADRLPALRTAYAAEAELAPWAGGGGGGGDGLVAALLRPLRRCVGGG